jgi:hypothetical protein
MDRLQDVAGRLGLADLVWLTAQDGRWHTIKELAAIVPLSAASVMEAVSFLVKFGFAEPSPGGRMSFRMIRGSPSPLEVAESLRALGLMRIDH